MVSLPSYNLGEAAGMSQVHLQLGSSFTLLKSVSPSFIPPFLKKKEKKFIQIRNCIAFSPISQLCEIIDGRLSNWPI